MTAGMSAANLANATLNVMRGTTFTGLTCYVKLHTGDPGASAASNASTVTTRSAITWSAASAGSMSISNTPTWTMTGTETISHISVWDASSAGNFIFSAALASSKSVVNTDVINLTTCTVSFTPIAA